MRDVGLYLGIVLLIGNRAGVLASGWLTDRLTRRGYQDAPMRAGLIGGLGVIIPAALFSQVVDFRGSLALLAVAMFLPASHWPPRRHPSVNGPEPYAGPGDRPLLPSMNILGITGGSTLVALCTDYVFQEEQLVGYSMSIISATSAAIGAILLGWGLKFLPVLIAR